MIQRLRHCRTADLDSTVRIISLKNVFTVFINLAVLGLHCFRGYSLVSVHWLLFAVISLLAAPGLSHAGSVDKVGSVRAQSRDLDLISHVIIACSVT